MEVIVEQQYHGEKVWEQMLSNSTKERQQEEEQIQNKEKEDNNKILANAFGELASSVEKNGEFIKGTDEAKVEELKSEMNDKDEGLKFSDEINIVGCVRNYIDPADKEALSEIESTPSNNIRDEIQPITEQFDVERVLEEQDTHDLYCPNCNSCITKRVILRKRKRNTRITSKDAKRNKSEADERQPPRAEGYSDTEAFRCLSCFSFFIPSGSGFQMFNIFGEKNEVAQGPQTVSQTSHEGDVLVAKGKDAIITIDFMGPSPHMERTFDEEGSQGTEVTVEARPSSPHTERVIHEKFQGVEIIKSIVYGGLAESIASLGIVSSAAGADTVTVNILALGLANLIGGLFIISQNLWDLKNDQFSDPTRRIAENAPIQVTSMQSRYQELLGRRKNFWIHAIVALLSFLVFGLLPPVIYAFTFRISDNKEYKLIAVASASLMCVLVLSMGKAYIQRPPKAYLKTISLYVVMVVTTSGVSYACGHLFKQLLEELGWFSSSVNLSLPILETPPSWTSF